MERPSLDTLEETIGYHFKNRYLLECALTHTSYANEQKVHVYKDYERLEFLGDAVLEMVSSVFLFRQYPDKHEGELTKTRAILVCEPSLDYCARQIGLEKYIRLGRGEEASGGRNKASIVSDVMEAVIGAMYLDSGDAKEPEKFILKFVLNDHENLRLFYDAKSILQERAQRDAKSVHYELLDETGPDHCRVFTVGVYLDGELAGTGQGHSKKAAEQQAAYTVIGKDNKKQPK